MTKEEYELAILGLTENYLNHKHQYPEDIIIWKIAFNLSLFGIVHLYKFGEKSQ